MTKTLRHTHFRTAALLVFLLVLAPGVLAPRAAQSAGFYDQPPMTEAELVKFVDELPAYLAWARQNNEKAHPSLSDEGRADFTYSNKAAAKVESMGWKAKRFFCVMGRTAAAMALQSKKPGAERPLMMPPVTPKELNLVRRHMDALEAAGG